MTDVKTISMSSYDTPIGRLSQIPTRAVALNFGFPSKRRAGLQGVLVSDSYLLHPRRTEIAKVSWMSVIMRVDYLIRGKY